MYGFQQTGNNHINHVIILDKLDLIFRSHNKLPAKLCTLRGVTASLFTWLSKSHKDCFTPMVIGQSDVMTIADYPQQFLAPQLPYMVCEANCRPRGNRYP